MRKFLIAAMMVVFGSAVSADPLEGAWRTAQDDNGNSGLVQIAPCGQSLCGTLVEAYGPNGNRIQSENVGRQIIWNTTPRGGGEYRGRIYSPDRGKEYASKLMLNGNSLSVSGCVLGICRSGGTWSRVR